MILTVCRLFGRLFRAVFAGGNLYSCVEKSFCVVFFAVLGYLGPCWIVFVFSWCVFGCFGVVLCCVSLFFRSILAHVEAQGA